MSDKGSRLFRYALHIEGFDERPVFAAESASKARAEAFRQIREAGYRLTFRDFLNRTTTLHFGRVKEDTP